MDYLGHVFTRDGFKTIKVKINGNRKYGKTEERETYKTNFTNNDLNTT